MTIAEYMLTKKKMAAEDQQNFINNILGVAKTGVDIWGAVNESQKYNPDSSYMKGEKTKIGWQTDAERQRADYTFGLQTKLADYDQKIKDAQAVGDQQRAIELAKEKHKFDMELQGLQNTGSMATARAKESSNQWLSPDKVVEFASTVIARKYGMPTGPDGQPQWIIPPAQKELIRKELLAYAPLAGPQQKTVATILNSLVDTGVQAPGGGGPPPPPPPPTSDILETLAATARDVVIPKYQTNTLTTRSQEDAENNLEEDLRKLIPQLQGEDKKAAEKALRESGAPGFMGNKRYAIVYAAKEALKRKLQSVPSRRRIE